jgi:hypothetical protein
MKTLVASIAELGDHVYITCPVSLYEPEQAEIEAFAFATDLRSAAPNPKILWLRGQYVEADQANRNADQWTAGELAIKALTPVLMPITVMHDLRSAVGTIADAKLLTPDADKVPRARIDTALAVWAHRFPEIAEECQVNASQGTLMQSMECLSPYYDCSVCGKMMQRTAKWQSDWKEHIAGHDSTVASDGRSPARILRNVTFTGVGLIFGTRGARGAMPDAHLEVEELAAMHREAHASTTTKRPRRKNTVEIEDSKYEGMVAAKSEADSKVATLTAENTELTRKVETLEAEKVKAEEERDAAKAEADAAKEAGRVAAMKDERLSAFGTGFRAKLDKHETMAQNVAKQAAAMSDEDWEARVAELEDVLSVKRDAKLDDKAGDGDKGGDGTDTTAGLLFDKKDVAASGVGGAGGESEVTAAATGEAPSVERRQSVMGGLVRKPKAKATA